MNDNPRPHHNSPTQQAARLTVPTLAACNFPTYFDNTRNCRPEWRAVFAAPELALYKVDIVVIDVTGFCEQGRLRWVGAGYTFFWSGATRRRCPGSYLKRLETWDDIIGELFGLL
ncbi:hypothetical protein SprV_0300999100 [Sparganum proliferum]